MGLLDSGKTEAVRQFNRFFSAQLRIYDRYAFGTTYTLTEGRILGEIHRNPSCDAAYITEALKMDKGLVSRILAKLVKEGLVVRRTNQEDGRRKHLNLTHEGEEVYEELEVLSNNLVQEMFESLSETEAERVIDSMGTMMEYMDSSFRLESGYHDLDAIRTLFNEYVTIELQQNLGVDIAFQDFEEELQHLEKKYPPETSGLFLITYKGNVAGCIAYYPLSATTIEIKRLYIQPEYRGHGLSKKAIEGLLTHARKRGYKQAYCDTLKRLKAANKLYRGMGFEQCEPYYHNPIEDVVFYKKDLT